MPEIDRKNDSLIISGIPGDKEPRTLSVDSAEAVNLIVELANKFQTTPENILKQFEDGAIEF